MRTEHDAARQMTLIALGFLIGVTTAYIIAPVHALAYLTVGTALAGGTVLGLSSDALFRKKSRSETQKKSEEAGSGGDVSSRIGSAGNELRVAVSEPPVYSPERGRGPHLGKRDLDSGRARGLAPNSRIVSRDCQQTAGDAIRNR